MAPNNKEEKVIEESTSLRAGKHLANAPPGEEVCISGAAGSFPDSNNIYEFRDNLFNKHDMVTENLRWKFNHPEIPKRMGKINDVEKFDASFFGVHYKQAHSMDPLCRVLLEKAYEAIVDAGVNPIELRGTSTGVFIGTCFSESERTWFYEHLQPYGFSITGSSRGRLANRISYVLGLNGPSYTVDTACSSSLYALEHAYRAIRDGQCDQALVGGCNLCLHPYPTLQFSRLGVLSPQGRCKTFDAQGNGYVRSEAIGMLFLQKARDCKRIYATIIHAKTNCDGYKEQGITYPAGQMQQQLLEEFYQECQMDPRKIEWMEAHGTGTRVGDPEECGALREVFCKGRTIPLPVGSVKSNIGHSEPASGICSVTKVIISMETGMIPPNLHYESPREEIPALNDGSLQVVTEPQPWNGGIVGINSFGFGGANAHVLLKWNPKSKINGGAPMDKIPRLVTISGRTEAAVNRILEDLEKRSPVDAEYVRLYQEIHSVRTPGHMYRGYILLKPGAPTRHVKYFSSISVPPRWFILSGLDSQWTGMGKSLLNLPAFVSAIEKCRQALKSKGVDVIKIVTEDKFEDLSHSIIGITAVQIGLIDVMDAVCVRPEGLIGHSIGEIAAGYADNCLTVEQAMLIAYYSGQALMETESVKGLMAQIDVGYEAVKGILSEDLEVACRNGPNSCVISGPAKSLTSLVNALKARMVNVKLIKSSNIAMHSGCISSVSTKLIKNLKKVIPNPKTRSPRWLSSSVAESQWNTQLSKLASAEYFANNLVSPVLFEDVAKHIPADAIVVEVSPDGGLVDVLASLEKKAVTVPLMEKEVDGVDYLLTALGKLYEIGLEPQLANLYPPVAFPVSRGTPMISPVIRWDHSQDWYVTSYEKYNVFKSGERGVEINVTDGDMEYYKGHVIDGRNLFPATGYLALVWETFALIHGCGKKELNVVFEKVRFHRATNLPSEGNVEFIVVIQKTSGKFEVVEGGAAIVTGTIYTSTEIESEMVDLPPPKTVQDPELIDLTTKDIYKELRLRGYNYSGLFKSIISTDNKGLTGKIQWSDNWVAFMDNMLQMQILLEDTRGLFVPTAIDKICINPKLHLSMVRKYNGEEEKIDTEFIPEDITHAVLDVNMHREVNIIKAGGIEIRGLQASAISRRKPLGEPVVEKYQFVPNTNERPVEGATLDLQEVLRICVHVGLENQLGIKVKAVELVDEETDPEKALLAPGLAQVLGDLPLIHAEIAVFSAPGNPLTTDLGHGISVEDNKLTAESNYMFVIGTNLLQRPAVLQLALSSIGSNGYLISRQKNGTVDGELTDLTVLNQYTVGDELIVLLKKAAAPSASVVIPIKQDDYSWVGQLQAVLKQDKTARNILMVAQGEPMSGILGLFNCIRKEPGGDRARCYFILDDSAPTFDPELPFYKHQIEQNLVLNVYKGGRWGSYRHLELKESPLINVKHAVCNATVRGDLSSFKWQQGPLDLDTHKLMPRTLLVQVYTSALNFRDVMLATGKLAAEVIAKGRQKLDCVQGLEFAGRDMTGRRVMGMVTAGAMATMVCADVDLMWEVPDHWSLEDAATVPVVYGTAYYALSLSGRMKKGDTVLIHAGSGGVGQAAINIALHEGCTVFTTVGTQEKRDFIKKTWPQLTDRHIGNSRDTSFEQLIMTETNGRGVDLVLNSLAEEKLLASVRCLAVGGRFLEIGKFDLANNNPLGMEIFLKETSFHGIMLDNLFHAPSSWKKPIFDILEQGIRDGAVKPLSKTVFSNQEVEQAFRFMATGKHIGKVLLKIRPEEKELTIVPEILLMKATPRFFCNPDHTYIIAGGLGGFGLELADWIVFRGARKVVLTSRTGMKTGYQSSRIRLMKSYGATVVISTEDISTEQGVTTLLTEANKLGPVGGIFNLAVVLLDAFFENQTTENFIKSAGPKAAATAYFDVISRRLCPKLTHFVIFSSVSCGRGNAGQTNYGMANSVMERICERRVKEGYPGLAVQWGAVGEVGLVADMQDEQHELVIGGTLQQRIGSCLEVLDSLLRQSNPVVASMVVAEKKAGSGGAGNIVDCVFNILGMRDLKTVSLHSTLAELGMDSMMAVEIKQSLEREFEVFLSPQDIRGLTFAKLAELSTSSADTSAVKATVSELNVDAMQFLLRAIGDEVEASRPVTELPSLVGKSDAPAVQPTLFVVPGIEGMASVLQPLAKNLKSKVTGLQLGYKSNVADTTKQMAELLLPHVVSTLAPNAPFNLLGYSFGGLVALQLALLLENAGHEGKLFIIDGSPDYLQEICNYQLVDGTEDNLQVNLLMAIINIIKKQDVLVTGKIRADLLALGTWNERVEHFLAISPEINYSIEYRKSVANATLKRILSIINFKWSETKKLKAKVTLLRPNQLQARSTPDQGISKYCNNPVDVHFVEGDHVSILESPKVAGIINNQVASFVEEQLTKSNQTVGKPSSSPALRLFKATRSIN